jgi:hypothetical protein
MRKRTKDQLCVYCCSRPATTDDHVLARGFVGVADRGNLPKVPSCLPCNNAKAALELHMTAVLPFGAVHADATRLLAEDVPRRLEQNRKLHRKLAEGMREEVVATEHGEPATRLVLPFEGPRLEELFAFITRGLMYFHWERYLDAGYTARAMVMREAGQPYWEKLRTHANASGLFAWDLGKGVLRYEGFYDTTNPNVTAWQFRMYGGVELAEEGESATMIIGQSIRAAALAAQG